DGQHRARDVSRRRLDRFDGQRRRLLARRESADGGHADDGGRCDDLDLDAAGALPGRPDPAHHRGRRHALPQRGAARLGSPRLLRTRARRGFAHPVSMTRLTTRGPHVTKQPFSVRSSVTTAALLAFGACAAAPNYNGGMPDGNAPESGPTTDASP